MNVNQMLAHGRGHKPAESPATAAGAHLAPGVVATGGRNPQEGSHLLTGAGRLRSPSGGIGRLEREAPTTRAGLDTGVTMARNDSFDSAMTSRMSGRHTIVVGRPKQGTVLPGEQPTPFGGVRAPRYASEIPGVNAGFPAPRGPSCSGSA